jgi:murein DD-endopeptidase MepM/ murein hydrolase activator NlpD
MKQKLPKKPSVTEKKGFYLALYSCVGAMLVLGAVFSFNNVFSSSITQNSSSGSSVNMDDLHPTGQSQIESYLAAEVRRREEEQSRPNENENRPTLEDFEPTNRGEEPVPETDVLDPPPSDGNATSSNQDDDENILAIEDVDIVMPTIVGFGAENLMSWPIEGQVVMEFSENSNIFDETLQQFRTNDSISISSSIGDQVRATADGTVASISYSDRSGHAVVIDHGNGWTTELNQLQEEILVSVGDTVTEGQVIGGINRPSRFTVLQGPHLGLRVSNDGNVIDPRTILSNN